MLNPTFTATDPVLGRVAFRDRKRWLWAASVLYPLIPFTGIAGARAHRQRAVAGAAAGHRLHRRADPRRLVGRGPEQPARGGGAAARGRPLLPLADLRGGAAALRRADRLRRLGRHAGPAVVGLPRAGLRGRHHLGPGHQHRPRTRPQAHRARTMAGQAGAGGAGLRSLPRRAQPRPPSLRGHARRPCQRAHGRKHLPLRAARAARRHAPRLGAGSRAAAPAGPIDAGVCTTNCCSPMPSARCCRAR